MQLKLKDRDKILEFLMKTDDSYNFKTVLPKIELTGEEKKALSDGAKLRSDPVMKELFSEDQLYEKCLEEKDQELARTLWKNIWEKDKLETLKELLGTSPEAEAVSMRLKTIRHMENLKQMGYPAEINERTIR